MELSREVREIEYVGIGYYAILVAYAVEVD